MRTCTALLGLLKLLSCWEKTAKRKIQETRQQNAFQGSKIKFITLSWRSQNSPLQPSHIQRDWRSPPAFTMALLDVVFNTSPLLPKVLIPVAAILAILFSLLLTTRTARVKVKRASGSVRTENGREYLLQVGDSDVVFQQQRNPQPPGRLTHFAISLSWRDLRITRLTLVVYVGRGDRGK